MQHLHFVKHPVHWRQVQGKLSSALRLFHTVLFSFSQLPAYEFEFSDTNPPVHAWSVLEVFRASTPRDFRFLKRAFMRLSLNFNW